MNVYDSEHAKCAGAAWHAPVDKPDDADLVVLNTCHIREGDRRVYSEIGGCACWAARRGRRPPAS
jgi:tRNA-2-methylthio-N6-dimethylallyladenosine synthase